MFKRLFTWSPKNFPIYYGWLIIVFGIVGVLMSVPGQTIGISVFTDYLMKSLNLSRVYLALAYLIGTAGSSFILTYAGKLYDRHGARKTAAIAGLGLGLVLIYMTKIDGLGFMMEPHLAGKISFEVLMFILVIIGFFGIRFFGQGVLTMVSRNMIMKWFNRKRGLASAILGIFLTFGFSYAPRLFDDLIKIYGWRGAWFMIALVIGLGFVLFALVFFKDNPQKFGLEPDGETFGKKEENTGKKGTRLKNILFFKLKKLPVYKPKMDYTLKDAKKTYSFWIFSLSLAMFTLFITALTFNVVSIFKNASLTREVALDIFLPSALVAVFFNVLFGWLSDFIKLKYLLFVELTGLALASIGLMFLNSGFPVWLIIVGNGMAQGSFSVLSSVTWPRFYGINHLGAISGYAMSFMVAGSAVGPLLFSLSLKYSDGYYLAGLGSLIITIILLILSFKAENVNEVKVMEK